MGIRMTSMIRRALGVLLAAWLIQSGAAPVLSIEPSTGGIGKGQSFSAGVVVRDASDLFAYQFDLAFDPALLEVTGVEEGGLLPAGGPTVFFPGIVDNQAGLISFVLGTLTDDLPGVSGDGDLARINFRARNATGIAGLSVLHITLLDSTLADIAFIPPEAAPVAVVPAPGTAPLVAAMLLVMGSMLRRRVSP